MENSGSLPSSTLLLESSPHDTIFCVGSGYSREELKSILLKKHRVLFGKIIYSPLELALKISGIDSKKVLSSKAAREELYDGLLKKIASENVPELKRLKRRKSFFRALDRALQQGRLAFSNDQELEALLSLCRLDEGRARLQKEITFFAQVWEKYLELQGWADSPLVFKHALEILKQGEWQLDSKIVVFQGNPLDTLETAFWNEISRHVREFHFFKTEGKENQKITRYEEHSPFECVETVADHCRAALSKGGKPIVLLPDGPEWRQLFLNALEVRKIPIHDGRNPAELRLSEALKSSLLPFRVAATRAERIVWLEYVRTYGEAGVFVELEKELGSLGFRNGREFCLGKSPELKPFFERMNVSEARAIHLKFNRSPELKDVLEKLWDSVEQSTLRLEQNSRKFPAQHWFQKLQTRLEELKPNPDTLRPKHSVVIHRLGQFPLFPENAALFVLGLPSDWVMGMDAGDWLFNEREREKLSTEFQLKSNSTVRESRLSSLRAWINQAATFASYEPRVNVDGKELESVTWVWKSLQADSESVVSVHHPRWSFSYIPELSIPTVKINLDHPPQPMSSITALDWQSRCGFLGLVFGRWKVEDLQEPGFTPWPSFRGTLLHRAAREMIEKSVNANAALEIALNENSWKGMFRSERTIGRLKQEFLQTLHAFEQKEAEYRERSGATPKYFEGPALKWEVDGLTVHGRPDRIDEHADGFFVIDYKTSSNVPSGREMVEHGYRVQLPFYALAFQKLFGKPVLGGQFVELTKDAKRTHGILQASRNGKKPGNLSSAGARSASILQEDIETIWTKSMSHIQRVVSQFKRGEHTALPVLDEECDSCMARSTCGRSRRNAHS